MAVEIRFGGGDKISALKVMSKQASVVVSSVALTLGKIVNFSWQCGGDNVQCAVAALTRRKMLATFDLTKPIVCSKMVIFMKAWHQIR